MQRRSIKEIQATYLPEVLQLRRDRRWDSSLGYFDSKRIARLLVAVIKAPSDSQLCVEGSLQRILASMGIRLPFLLLVATILFSYC